MNDLYDATHENVHLAVLDGTEALYVEKPPDAARCRCAPAGAGGSRCTPPRWAVLLAYAPESLFRGRSRRAWTATPHTRSSRPATCAGR